jgi:hypothetical protein
MLNLYHSCEQGQKRSAALQLRNLPSRMLRRLSLDPCSIPSAPPAHREVGAVVAARLRPHMPLSLNQWLSPVVLLGILRRSEKVS